MRDASGQARKFGRMGDTIGRVGNIRRLTSGVILSAALLGGGVVFGPSAVSAAQTPAPRVLQGKVADKGDAALKGAVVYLKDAHTLAVKSYLVGEDGSYRFGQLAQNTDYQVWAESGGKKSAVKSISSFDTKTDFNITLKIDTGK